AGSGEPGGNRADDRVLDECSDLAILERGVFRVADRVAIARLPVSETTADGKTPVALTRPVTLGAADRRVDHVVREHLRRDVIAVFLVEGNVFLLRQKLLDLRRQAHEFLQHCFRPSMPRPVLTAIPSPGRSPAVARYPGTPDRCPSPTGCTLSLRPTRGRSATGCADRATETGDRHTRRRGRADRSRTGPCAR